MFDFFTVLIVSTVFIYGALCLIEKLFKEPQENTCSKEKNKANDPATDAWL